MTIKQALERFKEYKMVVVGDKEFEADAFDELRLKTGEHVFWVQNGGDLWLSLDPESEEVIMFNEIDEPLDPTNDTILFNGIDYDLSVEGEAFVVDEDGEEIERILYKDFEGPKGEVLRVVENTVTNDITGSLGRKVTEEELQKP